MLAAQTAFGPHDQAIRSVDRLAFGRNLFRFLPEDAFDSQPLRGGGGRFMLTADVRIDKIIVGPFENNVFVVRSTGTGDAVIIDAANEHGIALVFASNRHFRH